jgi:glycosyltransferase involved in cell wall biosynthesis
VRCVGKMRAAPPAAGVETVRARTARFLFLMEHHLGHRAHAERLLESLNDVAGVDAELVPIRPPDKPRFPHVPGLRSWSFEASLQARSAFLRALSQGTVDAALVHTQVAALLLGDLMRKTPTVISIDATPRNFDSVGDGYRHSRGPALSEWAKWRVNVSVLGRARALIAWSSWVASSLISEYRVPASCVHIIPPGVALDEFRPSPHRGGGPRMRVLFVGADFRRKGGRDLVAAASRLADRVELDLVTPDEVLAPNPALVVRRHPSLRPGSQELRDLYGQADVFVMPTRAETYGIAVAEALASGLPIITTPVGALPEMVRTGENGFLIPPGRPDRLAEALSRLASSPELRAQLGRRSRDLAEAEHDRRRNHGAILELLREVSGRPE